MKQLQPSEFRTLVWGPRFEPGARGAEPCVNSVLPCAAGLLLTVSLGLVAERPDLCRHALLLEQLPAGGRGVKAFPGRRCWSAGGHRPPVTPGPL